MPGLLALLPGALHAFALSDVEKRAKALAAASYVKPSEELPADLAGLDYDKYKDIRLKSERIFWRNEGLPFELSFFHQGWYFKQAVKINQIARNGIREIKYNPDAFAFGANKLDPEKLKSLGFAGFSVRYKVNTPKYKDEVLAFLGASYFRALGKGQLYGLSARGLAIDTALISGEEFPRFVEFWIERPPLGAEQLTIYALLDSPRASGAYRFILKPGVDTSIDVKARLYLRSDIAKLGIAPLTTMYYYGENQRVNRDDYRPEIHDSDGLSVHAGNDEWLWRPLVNPRQLLVTSFAGANPVGFGLQQRDRQFTSYEDLAARYDKRPSAWVEPMGVWGDGRVELVQIPTPDETNDNIVAFWVPERELEPGQPYAFDYRVLWQKDSERRPPLLYVAQTRRGHGFKSRADDNVSLHIDFIGSLPPLRGDAEINSVARVDANAELLENRIERNEVSGGWRLSLRLRRIDAAKPVEMRAHLYRNNQVVSETWSYILPPD